MTELQRKIEELWDRRAELSPDDSDVNGIVHQAIELLDSGQARIIEIANGDVVVHQWLKQAILLLFKQSRMAVIEVGPFTFVDKIPLKSDYQQRGVRVVPGASARWGSYQAPGVVMMPSYVNIGAYIGENTMVDTWATVGSCAQIGKNVHLSGGVGIGRGTRTTNGEPCHRRGRGLHRQPGNDHEWCPRRCRRGSGIRRDPQ